MDKAPLHAFGDAFTIARRLYIDPLPAKTLMVRAVQGLATAPSLASPEQKRITAAAADRLAAMGADDVLPMLRNFGDALDALHATVGKPAMDGMLRDATAGMLNGLDPQTRFLPPAEAGAANDAAAGLKLTASLNGPLVTQAYYDGPAAKAGVQPGDGIVAIDGNSTKDLPLDDVVTLLRGPAGSSTTLLIRRGGASVAMPFDLTRAVIKIPLFSRRTIGSIAYLRVETFVPGAAQDLRRQFAELQSHAASPLSGIVLDLRDTPGGRLIEAVAAADELLPPATLIASTTGREADGNQRFIAAAGDFTGGLPMVMLVNEGTGAGSEIVAAALQGGRGAVVMGSHTAGAGLVATVAPLPPLGMIRLTTQRIILASGQPLKPPGVLPQIALMPHATEGSAPSNREAASSDPIFIRCGGGFHRRRKQGSCSTPRTRRRRISRCGKPAPRSRCCRPGSRHTRSGGAAAVHRSPLNREHVNLTSDYIWAATRASENSHIFKVTGNFANDGRQPMVHMRSGR